MNILQLIPYIICFSLSALAALGIYWLTNGVIYFKTSVEALLVWLILSIVAVILITFITLRTQQIVSDYQIHVTHQVYDHYCVV